MLHQRRGEHETTQHKEHQDCFIPAQKICNNASSIHHSTLNARRLNLIARWRHIQECRRRYDRKAVANHDTRHPDAAQAVERIHTPTCFSQHPPIHWPTFRPSADCATPLGIGEKASQRKIPRVHTRAHPGCLGSVVGGIELPVAIEQCRERPDRFGALSLHGPRQDHPISGCSRQ